MTRSGGAGARTRARELLVQALYQMRITGHGLSELEAQFRERDEYERVDQAFFDAALSDIVKQTASYLEDLAVFADRPVEQLDPVETGILLLGYHELAAMPEVPYRVVINEAVNLAKRFGAEDGHKYVNAMLDKASTTLRAAEHR